MNKTDKYKETKDRPCVCCGTIVTVTKFMSDKVVKCDICKGSNAKANPDILGKIKSPNSPKSTNNTKILPCVECGVDVEVTKFASASKVLCADCKGDRTNNEVLVNRRLKVDISKLDRSVIPPIEEYTVTPSLISNKALRKVRCPACDDGYMKILKVIDWSIFGLIVQYQCPHCLLLMSLSEQSNKFISHMDISKLYDYSGIEIENLLNATDHTKLHTTIRQLIKIITDNNITIDGIELPPYMYDNHRPVPVGFEIPKNDINIKIVDDTIQALSNPTVIDDVSAGQMVEKLKQLFRKENE